MNINDVIIIGAGPSGIAAAIQLKRQGIEPVLLEKNQVGGLLKNANLVENYPGFPDGISGLNLIFLFKKQLENLDIKIQYEQVLKVEFKNGIFSIITDKKIRKSKILVIASGTEPERLNIAENIENKIFYEVYPLINIKNKDIAIIGGGDGAFDYALNLGKHNRVKILNRSSSVKCLPILRERCLKNSGIKYLENITVEEIREENGKLNLICRQINNFQEIKADYLLVSIGRKPCLDFIDDDIIKKAQNGVIETLFITGDAQNGIYRQTSICVGDGVKAAMKICEGYHLF